MKVAFDCAYNDKGRGVCTAVLFNNWADATSATLTIAMENIPEYESGAFYKRELPLILLAYKVVCSVHGQPELLVIDGYTDLAQNTPGLGRRLHIETGVPVVGVAKNDFIGAPFSPILRGNSKKELFISAAGLPLINATRLIQNMHGPYRIPTLLKLADSLCREKLKRST